MTAFYSEMQFWSPVLGSDAARISMTDSNLGEFFMIVANPGGAAYKLTRDAAIAAIQDAIDAGHDPGEVTA